MLIAVKMVRSTVSRGTPTSSIEESKNCRATSHESNFRPVNHMLYLTVLTDVPVGFLNRSEGLMLECGKLSTRRCIRAAGVSKTLALLLWKKLLQVEESIQAVAGGRDIDRITFDFSAGSSP